MSNIREDIRQAFLSASKETLLISPVECFNAGVLYSEATLSARENEIEGRLPDGMKHCTILFKQCEKGHAWLTATNWVQHECNKCESDKNDETITRLREALEKIRSTAMETSASFQIATEALKTNSDESN